MKYFIVIIIIFLYTIGCTQCNRYQVYESFGTITMPTQGGTWSHNSVITVTSPVRSGLRAIGFNAAGDWIKTPQIASPGVFSFWYRRSSNTTAWSCVIETSPNGTTWTTRATISSITGAYQQYSIDLTSLSLSNVYIRVRDTRSTGSHERYIDDMAWTSTNSTQNTLLPLLSSCTQIISSPLTVIDNGSYAESYNDNLTQIVTFTTSDPEKKLELNISSLNIETNYDYLYVYDGPTTTSTLLATLTGTNSNLSYITSRSNSSITIKFTSDISNIGTWAGFQATISQVLALPVELLYFDAHSFEDACVLEWATASEHNSAYFELMQSTDGINWESINKTPAAGNSTQKLIYKSFAKLDRIYTNYYYKLLQFDSDGSLREYGAILVRNDYSEKRILKYVNMLGQDVSLSYTGIIIVIYEDGTMKKIIR